MKFEYIFAAFKAKEQYISILDCEHFLCLRESYYLQRLQRYKATPILYWILTSMCCICSLARMGLVVAFLIYITQISLVKMPKNNEIRVRANHSTSNFAPDSAKTVPYSAFQTEMNAKNQAYHFILSCNLLNEFAEFCEHYCLSDPHEGCQASLLLSQTKKSTKNLEL